MLINVTKSSLPPFGEYIEKIRPLWESRWLTNMGELHTELESRLCNYLQVPLISLLVNGHMAIEMTIQAYNFPLGAEIITSPFTFISTTHAIIRNGLKPVFCDINAFDGTIDVTKIEGLITNRTVAILPVHVYGNPCDVYAIDSIAKRYNLKVIYDAAHAFGVIYNGLGIGAFGDASIFSFHATKVFNSIEGGAVTSSSKDLYDKLYNLKNFGIRGPETVVDIGANAKMNEFCAAMGLCNLNHIDEALADRKRVNDYYDEYLREVIGIRTLKPRGGTIRNYAYYPIVLEDAYPYGRDELFDRLASEGILSRKYFYPLSCDQKCFGRKYIDNNLYIARDISSRILCLPIYEGLTEDILLIIVDIIRNI